LLPPDSPERPRLLVNLALATMAKGQMAEAEALLDEAAGTAQALGNEPLEWWARLERAFLHLHDLDPRQVRRDAEEALATLRRHDDQLGISRALGTLGIVEFLVGQVDLAGERLQEAAATARAAGSPWDEMRHVGVGVITPLFGTTPVDDALMAERKMLEDARHAPGVQSDAFCMIGVLLAMRAEFDEGRRMIARANAVAVELGRVAALAESGQSAGVIELLSGDPVAAEREFRESYEALERIGEELELAWTAALLARSLCEQGRYEDADRYATAVMSRVGGHTYAQIAGRAIKGRVLAHLGRIDEGERLIREAIRMVEKTDFLDLHADCMLYLADVFHIGQRQADAIKALDEAIKLYERKGNIAGAQRAREALK